MQIMQIVGTSFRYQITGAPKTTTLHGKFTINFQKNERKRNEKKNSNNEFFSLEQKSLNNERELNLIIRSMPMP